MALEQLLGSLTRETDAKAEAIVAAGRREAEAIGSRAAAERADRLAAAVADARRRHAAAMEEALARARQEADRDVLSARSDILQRVHAAALHDLRQRAAAPEVLAAASRLMASAVSYVSGDGPQGRCTPALRAGLAAPAAALGVTLTADLPHGIGTVVRSADGSLEVVATLDDALERAWPDEAIRLAAHLEQGR